MGYVGNQTTTSFTSMDKQTITGSGATTYTLSHNVSSESEIEVFVNNIRQEGGSGKAYTVSANQITFSEAVASSDSIYVVFQGKAIQTVVPPDGSVSSAKLATNIAVSGDLDVASNLDVGTIRATNGTTAMTINSSGDVIETNYMIDMFRLTADLDANGVLTNWERIDDASSGTIGTNMSVSSGIFTFPRTGLYRVDILVDVYTTNDDTATQGRFYVTQNDGGAWDEVVRVSAGEDGTDNVNNSISAFTLVNVTDTANVKVKLEVASLETGGAIEGSSGLSRTAIMFERKGASQ